MREEQTDGCLFVCGGLKMSILKDKGWIRCGMLIAQRELEEEDKQIQIHRVTTLIKRRIEKG